jgi:hypothetical protein
VTTATKTFDGWATAFDLSERERAAFVHPLLDLRNRGRAFSSGPPEHLWTLYVEDLDELAREARHVANVIDLADFANEADLYRRGR